MLDQTPAYATRGASVTQTTPQPPAVITMGNSAPITFRIINDNTGNHSGERIAQVKFRLRGRTTLLPSTVAPPGWKRKSFSTRSVTFRANSWDNAIAPGGNSPTTLKDFTLQFMGGSYSEDTVETLKSVSVTYKRTSVESDTQGKRRIKRPGRWILKALEISSFRTTNPAGTPISAEASGREFRLTMTVVNRSTRTQSRILTDPTPPSATRSGVITLPGNPPVSTLPNPMTLAAGATGTITFNYTTSASDNGQVFFSAMAQDRTGRATSIVATSNTLVISPFMAVLSAAPSCGYNGQNLMVTLRVNNTYSYAISAVVPTLTLSAGAPLVSVSGPTPSTLNINAGGSGIFTGSYRIGGGSPGDSFTVNGSARGRGETAGNPIVTTPVASSLPLKKGGNLPVITPLDTNADSRNQTLKWLFVNQGCAPIQSVSISATQGWSFGGNAYALVGQIPPLNSTSLPTELWEVSGNNPVLFSAPSGQRLEIGQSAEFSILFTATPKVAGTYSFFVTITDANGISETTSTSVIVNPFNSGPSNKTNTELFMEAFE